MESGEIKNRIKNLWRSASPNVSNDYFDLILEICADGGIMEYEFEGDELIGVIAGIPYLFGNSKDNVKGLLLMGMATAGKMRKRGVMTRLLAKINGRASEEGYAFTFLIPSDSGMIKYYQDRGYVKAFYRVEDNYTALHDFDNEYESILVDAKEKVADLKRKLYETLQPHRLKNDSEEEIDRITTLIQTEEGKQSDFRILHSAKDVENIIRKYRLEGGEIFYITNNSGEVTACAFTNSKDKSVVEVIRVYSSDLGSRYKVLSEIKRFRSDASLKVFVSTADMTGKALWSRAYGSVMPENAEVGTMSTAERVYSLAAHSKVYGLARILKISEILKFMANTRRDLKYSILVKEGVGQPVLRYTASKGELRVSEVDETSLNQTQLLSIMSPKEIGEIIFRRRDGDNLITEAFGIPSINASLSLLPG